jgi:hypothetical protein
MLITVGLLFALQNFTDWNFGKTWPVLLIVLGLMRRTVEPPPDPQAYYPYMPPPTPQPPQTGTYDPRTGAYIPPQPPSDNPYNAPPTGSRGGFGTSAPPKATGDDVTTPPAQTGGSL